MLIIHMHPDHSEGLIDLLQLFEICGGIPSLVTLPGTEISGAEAELEWAPNEAWDVQGGLGIAESKVVDVTGPNPLSLAEEGKGFTNTPDPTANLQATYTVPIGNNSLSLMVNYQHQSSAYNFLNARATYVFGENGDYTLALWGNNLTDEFACSSVIRGSGTAPGSNFSFDVSAYGEALYGLTFEANFGGT